MSALSFRGTNKAGRSAQKRYEELGQKWRVRVIPRVVRRGIPAIIVLLFVEVFVLQPRSHVALVLGIFLGGAWALCTLLPEALMPHHIQRWQVGAWGEELTQRELRALPSPEWVVRHDRAWGARWNHDHVVAGASVYVLNTKNVSDSRLTVEDNQLKLTRIDDEGRPYEADGWIAGVTAERLALKRLLQRELGFPVWVNPVIVVWGAFPAQVTYLGDVAIVHGRQLVSWLSNRPADLVSEKKRERVKKVVAAMPAATAD